MNCTIFSTQQHMCIYWKVFQAILEFSIRWLAILIWEGGTIYTSIHPFSSAPDSVSWRGWSPSHLSQDKMRDTAWTSHSLLLCNTYNGWKENSLVSNEAQVNIILNLLNCNESLPSKFSNCLYFFFFWWRFLLDGASR